MADYKIEVVPSAEKTLLKLPKKIVPKIIAVIQSLAHDPRPQGCRKLAGEKNTYRIRVQNYRIIYEIYDNLILIKVLKIGDRKDVYR